MVKNIQLIQKKAWKRKKKRRDGISKKQIARDLKIILVNILKCKFSENQSKSIILSE